MAATLAALAARVLQRLGVSMVPLADRPSGAGTTTGAGIGLAALRRLGVVSADTPASAADQAAAETQVAAVHAGLVGQGAADWPASAIPAGVGDAYAVMVAALIASQFGLAGDLQALAAGEAQVRRFTLANGRGQGLAEQALRDVHRDLAARGKVRWLLISLPVHAEEPYVMMASYLLAPRVGGQANPDDWLTGERSLLRAIALPSSGDPVRAEYF